MNWFVSWLAGMILWFITLAVSAWAFMVGMQSWHEHTHSVPGINYGAALLIVTGIATACSAAVKYNDWSK